MKLKTDLLSGFVAGIIIITMIIAASMFVIDGRIRDVEYINTELNDTHQASVNTLSKLFDKYREVKKLVNLWVLSPVEADRLFEKEFDEIYNNHIFPLSGELLLMSGAWDNEDRNLLNEIILMLRETLHDEFLDLANKATELKTTDGYPFGELTALVEEGNILFLYSEIEQDFNYLIDKRNALIKSMVNDSEIKTKKIRKSIFIHSLFLLLVFYFIASSLLFYASKSARGIQQDILSLSSGIIPPPLPTGTSDLFGKLNISLNKLHEYLHRLVQAMLKIKDKDFNHDFTPVSEHDVAGNAILDLNENLMISQTEEEKRKKEELERAWVADGIARINDILRSSGDKIEDLTYMLIREIVVYTDSKLGAIYILNNENPDNVFLEMTAVYAYDRKKHLKKEVLIGEGLVGRCVKENETIYLTDVPGDYISIKSGLGETNPVSLLIVPLKTGDDTVHGAVEIASFSFMAPYRIHFIETVGENIATSISKMKINLSTKKLLEHTRQQAEEMITQEEEMRQNMEELRATQEQSAIREEKLNKEIERLKALLNSK